MCNVWGQKRITYTVSYTLLRITLRLNFKSFSIGGVDSSHLAAGSDRRLAFLNAVIHFRIPQNVGISWAAEELLAFGNFSAVQNICMQRRASHSFITFTMGEMHIFTLLCDSVCKNYIKLLFIVNRLLALHDKVCIIKANDRK